MCGGWKWAISQRKWWHLGQGLDGEHEKPGLAGTWRKLTGTWVERCRSSTWCPFRIIILRHAGSPGPVTCWHLTFKCTKSEASSFWPSVILIDSFSAFLSSAPGSHTVCVITAGFCLCAIPADSGAAYKPACVKVQCFTLYVDTEICISVCFDHVKACLFPRYLPWGSTDPSSLCSTGLWDNKIIPGFLAETYFSVLAEQRDLVCCMLTRSFVCWLGNFTMDTAMCVEAKCFPTL